MNKIDYQALREAAEKATWGDWDSYKPHRGARGYEVRLSSQAIAQHVLKNNAEFIAAFNPKIALALLDEREAQNKRIAELKANLVALAAENAVIKSAIPEPRDIEDDNDNMDDVSLAEDFGFNHAIEWMRRRIPETPATDAFLAEVRAQGVDMARNAMIDFVDGEIGPNKNVPGLIRGAEICVSIAEQLRKGGNQ
ncbi:ead/Ea22-like family protein [Escherichia coli]|uniref:ead/Ea22-like family protein n=1 Tax=Escherichia coli TaxID=562 RepID=UPI002024AF9F|nr:ead/Ea22-like family protein [Escherichia coli]